MEKGTLTLYTVISNPERIATSIQERFKEMTKEVASGNNRITLTLHDDSLLLFNFNHQQDKPDFIASHTAGMANFFKQAETEAKALKENVLRQICVFNSVTGISFDLDDNADRTDYIINRLYEIAGDVHGFLLYPNMHIYTPEGKLLFSSKGETELTEFTPIGNADLLDTGRPEETEAEVVLRSREALVQRAVALFAVAVYSEVMLSETPDRQEALAYLQKMDELYGARAYLTPVERVYLQTPSPERQQCIQFVWRYECCGVLLWAAGITDELPYPSEVIDVPVLAAIFWQHKGISDLLSKGFARPQSEILDAADLTLRYDRALVDARVHGKEAPAGLNGGIVVERHYAFNWMIGANGGADWDNVQPST